MEEGESPYAYFFRLEKKNGTDRNISVLRASDGSLVTDKDGLCEIFRSFYLDLFSAAPCDSNARAELLSNISSVLPFHDSEVCECLLSQEECFAALQGMARGKAPGCDSLPMEFYLKVWHVLGFCLYAECLQVLYLGPWNDIRFRGVRPLAVDVMERVKSWVRFNLPLVFCRFRSDCRRRYFVCQWGARGVVAWLRNDVLVVHI